jgi:hypothetical protein
LGSDNYRPWPNAVLSSGGLFDMVILVVDPYRLMCFIDMTTQTRDETIVTPYTMENSSVDSEWACDGLSSILWIAAGGAY